MPAPNSLTRNCPYCGNLSGCDCIERRDCPKAGQPGHRGCGPCSHNPQNPVFTCTLCFTRAYEEATTEPYRGKGFTNRNAILRKKSRRAQRKLKENSRR